jgi:nitrate/nitrite-specific signal transduction histidine kinase
MIKLTSKIALPIILAGIIAVSVFIFLDYEKLEPGSYIIIGLFFIFIFLFGFTSGQNLTNPIRKLLKRAIDLNNGDLKSRIYLESKDELAELAKVFNQIAERLEQSQAGEGNIDKAVSIKVEAQTKYLKEAIVALEQKVKNRTIELQRANDEIKKLQHEVKSKQPNTNKDN